MKKIQETTLRSISGGRPGAFIDGCPRAYFDPLWGCSA